MRLKDRTILVTGASKGIGAATARRLAVDGCEVVLISRSPEPLNTLADEINTNGGRADYFCADVSSEEQCRAAVQYAIERFGKLDGLFNNAGACLEEDSGLLETSLETWTSSLELNLSSVFFMSRAAVPTMAHSRQAAILNNASMVAHIGSAHPQIAYCAAKGGVVSMSREMAIELAPMGIRVNALSPGPINTEMYQSIQERYPKFMQDRLPHLPMNRFGQREEIASVAAFLLSEEASYMTGQSIVVDGGITAAYTTKDNPSQ